MNLNHPPQLELKLAATMPARRPARPTRLNRAAWWFDRMRRIADSAMDWPSAPAGVATARRHNAALRSAP